MLNEGLEELGDWCKGPHCIRAFCSSRIEEITLPSTLREIDVHTFECCKNLRTIYTKNNSKIDISQLIIPASAQIVILSD